MLPTYLTDSPYKIVILTSILYIMGVKLTSIHYFALNRKGIFERISIYLNIPTSKTK